MRAISIWLAILCSAAAIAGCGNGSSSSTAAGGATSSTPPIHLAKTKFVLHAGLAFGAFHRYIYKP